MKKASIISIGNELLNGQTISTNAAYLSERLFSIGIPVVGSYTIGDDVDSIVRVLHLASDDGDIIVASGGLGPTDDDVTRQAFAKFLGSELQLQDELLERIESFFANQDLVMPEKTKIQAYIPAGAKALLNNLGTAPGIMAEYKGKLFSETTSGSRRAETTPQVSETTSGSRRAVTTPQVFALPGVPAEMKEMFEGQVLPKLTAAAIGQVIVVRKLRCFGTGESAVAELIGDVMKRGRNPLINCTAKHGVITLHIVATAKDKSTAERMAEEDEKMLRKCLGELVYGVGEQTLAEVVGQKLARQKKTIAVAESCTGGVLAKLITDVAGASRYFTHGWVTYSDQAKTGELGVPADLIERYGAVSEGVAEAMAVGARKKAKTDFAIGITGIAGPSGGPAAPTRVGRRGGRSEQKPVGLVYISVVSDNYTETKHFIFRDNVGLQTCGNDTAGVRDDVGLQTCGNDTAGVSGNRQLIRLRAALTGLNMLRLQL